INKSRRVSLARAGGVVIKYQQILSLFTHHPGRSIKDASRSLLMSRPPLGEEGKTVPQLRHLRLNDFNHVIIDFLGDFFEPVRNTGWNDHDVTFCKVSGLATIDTRPELLVWPRNLSSNHRATGHNGGFPVQNIKGVGFLIVNFHLTGTGAAIHGNRKIWRRHQTSAFGDLLMINVSNG